MLRALLKLGQQPRVSKRLLGVKGIALEKAMVSNASIDTSPTMPAIERYTGVMYDSIGYQSFGESAREVFDQTVVIMSGLFGMVSPKDLIPDYKLKMGAALLRRKTCATVWKPIISKSLKDVVDDGVIWDLLPLEHSAAWDPATVPYSARFTFKFLEQTEQGKLKTITHLSKVLKGALISHLVNNPEEAKSPETALKLIEGFSHPEGYAFAPEMTKKDAGTTEVVFLKT